MNKAWWRHPVVLLSVCVVGAGLVFVVNGGCTTRPRAPAIFDEPVYNNVQEGFRFFPPEGWRCHGRGEFPQMEMKKERLLVEYKRVGRGKPASLMVSVIDLPQSRAVADYLQERLHKKSNMRFAVVEKLEIDHRPLERYVFTGRENDEDRVREVVVLRRQQRTYIFTGGFAAADKKGKDEIRTALASLVCNW